MKLLPNRRLVVVSDLSLQKIVEALRSHTERKRLFRFGGGYSKFEGSIRETSFEIERIITGRNSFKAIAAGIIDDDGYKRRITINLKMHDFVTVFWIIWMSLACLASVGVLVLALAEKRFDAGFLVPFGLVAFGWALCRLAFGSDAKQLINDILELTDGTCEQVVAHNSGGCAPSA